MSYLPCRVGDIEHPATDTVTLILMPVHGPPFPMPSLLSLGLACCEAHRDTVVERIKSSWPEIERVVRERGGPAPDRERLGFRWDPLPRIIARPQA